MTFENETVWIIGASSGIGRALAHELDTHKAHLILSARTEAALQDLNTELGQRHTVLKLDITDPASVMAALTTIDTNNTVLQRVICLAGHYEPSPFKDLNINTIRQIIDINLTGTLHFVHAVLPLLIKQGKSQLALCGSVAGYRGLPNSQPYSATKAALINFAESLKVEVEPLGIDVRIMNPGFVRTPMTAKNDFSMPMMINATQAARSIIDGLETSHFEIRFPRFFTTCMKILKFLPAPLYFGITRQIRSVKP